MNRSKNLYQVAAAVLCISLLLPAVPAGTGTVRAAEEVSAGATLTISSADELIEFSRNCSTEIYSQGKTFVLDGDIDLQEQDFIPIPVFAGVFDGNGYQIKGLKVTAAGSDLGLFRYIQAGAVVRNLSVSGRIQPAGSKTGIGGIAGVNRGTIQSCSFTGSAAAAGVLGGIAGYNEAGGRIEDCMNLAELTGNDRVGGIAGYNEGMIFNCRNEGPVNISGEGVDQEEGDGFSFDQDIRDTQLRAEKVNDVGGIAGLSPGQISGCVNYSAVGYPHVGYNIGGIAGRQSGRIENCSNYGDIKGRKDVGGIAGQLEPYLTKYYDRDTLDRLEDEMDVLSEMADQMSGSVRNTTDTASEHLDQTRDVLKEIKDYTRSYKNRRQDIRREFDTSLTAQLDAVYDAADQVELELGSNTAARAASRIRANVERARELSGMLTDTDDDEEVIGQVEGVYEVLLGLADCAGEIAVDAETVITEGSRGIEDGIYEFKDEVGVLREEARELSALIREYKDSLTGDLDAYDAGLTEKLDRLSGYLDVTSDDFKSGKKEIQGEKDEISSQIDTVQDVLTDGKVQVRDRIDRLDDEEEHLYEDISDLDSGETGNGKIISCINAGMIEADYQAGGIAGMLGIEISLDPEKDVDVSGDKTLNITRNASASIHTCRNEGEVRVKNDYAGGIIGKAALGAVIENENYGNIIAADGDYAGGIAGSMDGTVRNNCSMSRISGNRYLGGIAGWGKNIKANYAMSVIVSENGELQGSIAGDADRDGVIADNCYVEEQLGAIDGVTLIGEAVGVTYEAFVDMAEVPGSFSSLTVSFYADGVLIEQASCSYGQPFPMELVPAAPAREGYYYIWETAELSTVKSNLAIHANYCPWTRTIASSAEMMPLLLAEADFYPDTGLSIRELSPEAAKGVAGYRVVKQYDCEFTGPDEVSVPDVITYRVLEADHRNNVSVGIIRDGRVMLTDTRRDGSYLVFEMAGSGPFVIMEQKSPVGASGWAAAFAVLGAAVVWGAVRHRKKSGKQKQEDLPLGDEND